MICIEQDRSGEAEHYLGEAEKYIIDFGDKKHYLVSEYYLAKSKYFFGRKDYDQAIVNAMKSTDICVTMGLAIDGADSLQIVAESYSKLGLHEMAYTTSMKIVELLRHPLTRGKEN